MSTSAVKRTFLFIFVFFLLLFFFFFLVMAAAEAAERMMFVLSMIRAPAHFAEMPNTTRLLAKAGLH